MKREPALVRFADRVVECTVSETQRGAIIGDLRERADQRLTGGDRPVVVWWWYLRSALSVGFHFSREAGARRLHRLAVRTPRARPEQHFSKEVRGMLNDLRFSVRSLVRRPLFSLVVIGTLALGVGANTAIFTVVRNVVLRPVPYPESEGLVSLWMEFRRDADVPGFEIVASEPEYLEFAEATESFAAVAGFWTGRVNLTGRDEPIRITSATVSANFFDVVGIPPAVGRPFVPHEDVTGAARVAVITDGLWDRAFGRDSGLVGRSVVADGRSYEVVGVMPPGFSFPGEDVDFMRPNYIDPANLAGRSSHYLQLLGRLKRGVTVTEAHAEAAVLNARLGAEQPGLHGLSREHPMIMSSYQSKLTGPVRPALWVLTGAAGLVLLIACANVANLMFVRSESRGRELAIRQALGAGRGRLIGHMLAESLMLGVVGTGVGLWLSTMAVPFLATMGSHHLPRSDVWRVDGMVIAFAAGLAVATSLVFGLAPALGGTRERRLVLREGGSSPSRARARVRNGLLVSQLAVAVVLLIGAGVLTRNLMTLMEVDPGFDADGVVTMTFALDVSRYESQESMTDFHRRLDERLAALPSVIRSGAIRSLPLATDGGFESLEATGVRQVEDEDINALYQVASAGYFEALSIPVLQGRQFDRTDGASADPVVVVNRAMAERYWPDGDALGNRIKLGPGHGSNPDMTIIGIVGDVIHRGLGRAPTPQIFVPRAQAGAIYEGLGTRTATVAIRGTVPPAALMAQVRSVFRELDPAIPLSNVQTMESVVVRSVADERFMSVLLGIFSSVALALAAIGVYGLMSYLVVQRTREIGVRMALGASRQQVIGYVVRRSMLVTLIGSSVGLLAALAGSRLLETFVSSVSVRDPWVYAIGPALLLVTAAAAAYGPARRAAAVDPMEAVRAG